MSAVSGETVFAFAFDQQDLYKEVTLKTPSNSMKAGVCSCWLRLFVSAKS